MTIAPSLLGEVTRYVADIRKARDLLGWEPQVPLDEGIPRAVAWFREHRAAHPEENKPVVNEGDSAIGWKTLAADPPSVLGIFGPTASGKTAVAEAIAERIPAELVSADSMQVYRGLPILTNQDAGARLVGIWPLDRQGTVGEYQRLAHAAIDEIVAAGRTPVVVGGSGLWFQAALTDVELPPDVPPARRARWERLYDRRGARDRARPAASAATRARPRGCIRTTASASSARSSSGRRATTLVPEEPRLWTARAARADARRRPRGRARDAGRADRASSARAMFEQGVEEEVRAAGDVAPQVLGLEAVRDAAARSRRSPSSSARRSASPPTSASGCAASPASS